MEFLFVGSDRRRGEEEVALLSAVWLGGGGEVDVDAGVDCDGHFDCISFSLFLSFLSSSFVWLFFMFLCFHLVWFAEGKEDMFVGPEGKKR